MRLILLIFAIALSGCATNQGLYKWGDYEQDLYLSYKDPTQVESLRIKLETYVNAMSSQQQKVAPGIYAELGTLYLQLGASDKALTMYTKERDAWPESRTLMTAMIQNIERRRESVKQAEK